MERLLRSKEDYYKTILRNQLTSLVLFESIKTTRAKAAKFIPYANHFFNRIKPGDLNSKKLAHQTLFNKSAIFKCFEEILPRYKSDETTFVKKLNMAPRAGDNAQMALVMLTRTLIVEEPKKAKAKTEKTEAKSKVTTEETK